MKKSLIIILVACLALCSQKTLAQKETKKWGIGFFPESGLTTGNATNTYNLTTGASLRFFYRAGPGFVTLAGGGVAYLPKNLSSILSGSTDTSGTLDIKYKAGVAIPVKVGYKYIFKHYFFVMGELGISTFHYYYTDADDNSQNITYKGCFTYAPTIGFQYHAFEIGIKYEVLQIKGGGSISNIGLRTGINF